MYVRRYSKLLAQSGKSKQKVANRAFDSHFRQHALHVRLRVRVVNETDLLEMKHDRLENVTDLTW